MKIEIDYDILIRFYQQKCTEEERRKVMRWVNASSENAALFFKWEELYFLGKMPVADAQEQMEKAEKKFFLRIQKEEHSQHFLFSAHRWMQYAAVVAVVLAFSGMLAWFWSEGRTEWMVASTGPGENISIVLPDSSKVWLMKILH